MKDTMSSVKCAADTGHCGRLSATISGATCAGRQAIQDPQFTSCKGCPTGRLVVLRLRASEKQKAEVEPKRQRKQPGRPAMWPHSDDGPSSKAAEQPSWSLDAEALEGLLKPRS